MTATLVSPSAYGRVAFPRPLAPNLYRRAVESRSSRADEIPRGNVYSFVEAFPFRGGQPDELRERWRGLASGAAQFWDQAIERRLGMPVEFAQIDLLELATARTPDIEETVIRGECDADHRRPVWFVPPLHQPVPLVHGRGAERRLRGIVLTPGGTFFLLDVLVAGSHAHGAIVCASGSRRQAARD